jgi:virulence factor Mce-like protein
VRLGRRRTSGEPARRALRKDRTGGDAFKVGAITLLVLAVLVYFGFAKNIPFTHGFRLKAAFETSNELRVNSPVRIAGVNVGKVKAVERDPDSDVAIVEMELDNKALPIHKDAQVKIRPRIFLEGNYFVDIKPGTPSAPTVDDGDTLPVTQSATPVQLDQVLGILQKDTRESLSKTLRGLGDALTRTPSPADDRDGDPATRGQSAARSLNDAISYGEDAARSSAIVADALTGEQRDDVARLLRGLSRTTEGLGRNERQLQSFITNFNRTLAATNAEAANLRAAIRELGPTLESADRALTSLNAAFPNTRAFARDILPGVRETPATVAASFPWIREARPLLSRRELGGLVAQLRPGTVLLARLATQNLGLMRETGLLSRCVNQNILPTINTKLDDGPLSTGATNAEEFWYALVGLAGEGQGFDANGQYVRLSPGGGDNVLELKGNGPTRYGALPTTPLGTRPAWPDRKPPYRPGVACDTQRPPNLAARTGPSDALGAGTATARGGARP